MPYEFHQSHERVAKAIKKQAAGVGELIRSLCPADSVPLNPEGRCPVCGRTPKAPATPDSSQVPNNGRLNTASKPRYKPTDTDDTPPASKRPEPKATWPDGTPIVVGAAQEAAQAEFWRRYNRRKEQERAEAEEKATQQDEQPRHFNRERFLADPQKYLRF